ncbi:arginine--tRNA ligase [Clostridium hydrogenum]|uniref:arginine--tRNA ligase n=1 Tax=Clostridium hydrogenum TaxID=2855764 RepID=UPI002E3398F6|nr:arginine--tRNA ligase [Clostridium hydrogenum]
MNYHKIIAERIKFQIDMEIKNLESLIEVPPKSEMGDFALPCFQFSKVMRKAPNIIAEELAKQMEIDGFEKIQNNGPYINFFVDKSIYIKNTVESILKEKDKYGSSKIGEGKTITIEYSSPNIDKPFHIGHLFSTAIGNSLYKIFSFEGYNCVKINHIGDFETQFGKIISANGESFYNEKVESIVNEMKEKGLLVESNGAKVVMLDEYNMPPCIIQKSDGARICRSMDIAAAEYRKKTYNFDKNIYVIGLEQSLYYKQVFKTLELAGYEWAKNCLHVGFGLVRFADRKLLIRKEEDNFLKYLLKKAILKANEIINEKSPNLENVEEAAKRLGIGSILFTYLKSEREKDIAFNWNEVLSFDGETGIYVQYTYATAKSILRKAGKISPEVNYKKLKAALEFELAKKLHGFNDAIISAMDKLEPFVITRYVIDVAKAFNKFYNSCNIINTDDEELKNARLVIVEATSIVIKNALYLLGIETVEKM